MSSTSRWEKYPCDVQLPVRQAPNGFRRQQTKETARPNDKKGTATNTIASGILLFPNQSAHLEPDRNYDSTTKTGANNNSRNCDMSHVGHGQMSASSTTFVCSRVNESPTSFGIVG